MTDSEESRGPEIPPFKEEEGAGGLKAIGQLFLVPAMIVLVAVGVFLSMNFLVGGDRAPEDILQQVASGDSRRRGQAAFELSKRLAAAPELLEDTAFQANLLAVYERTAGGDPEPRRYLTRVLSFATIPAAIPSLLEATQDADPETRLYAVVALGNAKAYEAIPRLVELTRDDDPGIRSVAVAGLASIGDPTAISAVEARLTDGALDVAWNAANALTHLGSAAGEGLLLQMLDSAYLAKQPEMTPQLAQQTMLMAVEGLGRLEKVLPSAERRARLEELSQEADHPLIQEAAIRALRAN